MAPREGRGVALTLHGDDGLERPRIAHSRRKVSAFRSRFRSCRLRMRCLSVSTSDYQIRHTLFHLDHSIVIMRLAS